MAPSFVAPDFLRALGPPGFTRQVERLALHLGFTEVVNIDGSYDQGGDVLALREGKLWVFQAKWKAGATVPPSAIDEVLHAKAHYGADHAVVVTNSRFGPTTRKRRDNLAAAGMRVELWSGHELLDLYEDDAFATPRLPAPTLRPYQAQALQAVLDDLHSSERALLVLATGLGKTVVGGEVIAHHLSRNPTDKVLVVAPAKDLVDQLERALWQHLPKGIRTQLLTGDQRPEDLRGVTCATVTSALGYARAGYRPALVMVDEAHHVAEGRAVGRTARHSLGQLSVRGDRDTVAGRPLRHTPPVRRTELHARH